MRLSRFFAGAVFICFALTAGAQSGEYRYVVAPILFSESGGYVNGGFTPHGFSGIVLKRSAGKVNYRIAAEYTRARRIRNAPPDSYDMPDFVYNERQGLFRAGMEKGLEIGRYVRLYGALDLVVAYTRTLEEWDGDIAGERMGYVTKVLSTGLMPALGLEVSLCPRISLAAETRARLLVSAELNSNQYGSVQYLHWMTNRLGGLMLNVHL